MKRGRRALVLRTFSKIYGLAGLAGRATRSGPPDVCAAMAKMRRPFDVTTPRRSRRSRASTTRPRSRRRRALNAAGLARLAATLREHGLEPVDGAVGNFLYVEVGEDAAAALRAAARARA